MNRNWMYVFLAAVLEVVWVTGLKHAYNWWTWAGTVVAIIMCSIMLIRASNRLPVGTTYAVFAGLGTGGTVVVEMLVFGEPFKIAKLLLIVLLLTGVIGLKMVTVEKETEGEHA